MSDSGTDRKIGIAGSGRLAQAMGRLLKEAGQPVTVVAGRRIEAAQIAASFIGAPLHVDDVASFVKSCNDVLIAVSDDALEQVASRLASAGLRRARILHTSGVEGLEILRPLLKNGNDCACLHPLQTVPTPDEGLQALPGATFALTGEGPAAVWAEEIVGLLGGRTLRVKEEGKALYHAGAVMAANYLLALLDAGLFLMNSAGVDAPEARKALAPLLRQSLENGLKNGPGPALTGPLRRGDLRCVQKHLAAMESLPKSVRRLYCAAGLQALDLARRNGLASDAAERIESVLDRTLHD